MPSVFFSDIVWSKMWNAYFTLANQEKLGFMCIRMDLTYSYWKSLFSWLALSRNSVVLGSCQYPLGCFFVSYATFRYDNIQLNYVLGTTKSTSFYNPRQVSLIHEQCYNESQIYWWFLGKQCSNIPGYVNFENQSWWLDIFCATTLNCIS